MLITMLCMQIIWLPVSSVYYLAKEEKLYIIWKKASISYER